MFTNSLVSAVTFLALLAPGIVYSAPAPSQSSTVLRRDYGPDSIVTNQAAKLWYDPNFDDGTDNTTGSPFKSYVCYTGTTEQFPPITQWISYNGMQSMASQVFFDINNIDYYQDIWDSIVEVSTKSLVDARFILATILTESSLNPNVECTKSYGGVENCGLMQAYNSSSFDPSNAAASIHQMIVEGVQGTQWGPGSVQLFNDVNGGTRGNIYAVMREYNSGGLDPDNMSNGLGASDSYVSDVTNYLMGWAGPYNSPRPDCVWQIPESKPTCSVAEFVPRPADGVSGTTANCCEYYKIKAGETCQSVSNDHHISLADLYAWNSLLDSSCSNLWAGNSYCVNGNITAATTSSTLTTSQTTSPTVTPTQSTPSSTDTTIPSPTPSSSQSSVITSSPTTSSTTSTNTDTSSKIETSSPTSSPTSTTTSSDLTSTITSETSQPSGYTVTSTIITVVTAKKSCKAKYSTTPITSPTIATITPPSYE